MTGQVDSDAPTSIAGDPVEDMPPKQTVGEEAVNEHRWSGSSDIKIADGAGCGRGVAPVTFKR